MIPPDLLSGISTALVYFLAGFFSFFVIFNRFILQMEQGRRKTLISYGTMILLFTGPSVFGFVKGPDALMLFPAALLMIYAAGELYRRYVRAGYLGIKPEESMLYSERKSFLVTTTAIICRKYSISLPGWPRPGSFRIVHMTDFHVDDDLPAGYYSECVKWAVKLNPDLIVLTGDFVNRKSYAALLSELLLPLKAPFGVYAVLGNHDYWAGADHVRSALELAGVVVLSGSCRSIDLHAARKITICGTEQPWGPGYKCDDNSPSADHPVIGLSHTPDNVYKWPDPRPSLVFCGHFHGGQWRFPGLGPLVVPSTHGRLLDHGHYRIENENVFISAGIGTAWFPMRLMCSPEILVVDISGEDNR